MPAKAARQGRHNVAPRGRRCERGGITAKPTGGAPWLPFSTRTSRENCRGDGVAQPYDPDDPELRLTAGASGRPIGEVVVPHRTRYEDVAVPEEESWDREPSTVLR